MVAACRTVTRLVDASGIGRGDWIASEHVRGLGVRQERGR